MINSMEDALHFTQHLDFLFYRYLKIYKILWHKTTSLTFELYSTYPIEREEGTAALWGHVWTIGISQKSYRNLTEINSI